MEDYEDSFLRMVERTEVVHTIVAASGQKNFPSQFIVDSERLISIENLKSDFQNVKYGPILIASGLERKEFERLKDANSDYPVGLIYEQRNDQFFIVDYSSFGHSAYAGSLMKFWPTAFNLEFDRSSEIFSWNTDPGVESMAPDMSIWVFNEFCLFEEDLKRPFLALEVAWSQSSSSLQQKIQNWLDLGVMWVVGIDRSFLNDSVHIFIREKGNENLILDLKYNVGDYAEFDVVLPKSSFFARFNIQDRDLHPERKELILHVEIKIL
jgi:hypothetical protein